MDVVASILVVYVGLVLLAEALAWRLQPPMEGGVTLRIRGKNGETLERTVYGHWLDDILYVSSNHWFRSWYHAIRRHRELEVVRDGRTQRYRAEDVVAEERSRVLESYRMGFLLRLLCGFAPRRLLRLEPVA